MSTRSHRDTLSDMRLWNIVPCRANLPWSDVLPNGRVGCPLHKFQRATRIRCSANLARSSYSRARSSKVRTTFRSTVQRASQRQRAAWLRRVSDLALFDMAPEAHCLTFVNPLLEPTVPGPMRSEDICAFSTASQRSKLTEAARRGGSEPPGPKPAASCCPHLKRLRWIPCRATVAGIAVLCCDDLLQ